MIHKDVHVFLHLVPTNYIVAEKAAAVTVHVALYTVHRRLHVSGK